MPVERVVDGTAEVVLDDHLSPILIVTWFGTPTPPILRAFHVWVDERIADARVRGGQLVLINDSTDSERRRVTNHSFDMNVLIAAPTVITQAWKTLPDAFEHARSALRQVGAKPPPPSRINAYVRPQREV